MASVFYATLVKSTIFVISSSTISSIIEIKVTTAQGESFDSNLKVNAEDMEMIEQLKNLTLER